MILKTKDLTKHFGGLTAVNNVDLQVEEGHIHAIIGPNGAGKTTFFNMLTGELPVSAGNVFFKEKNITGLKPYQIARTGIGRSFQQNKLFLNLTVLENVRLAEHARHKGHFNFFNHFLFYSPPLEKAVQILEELDMGEIAALKAGELSHGQQRTLEVAMALAAEPELLLLDEPTSGMSPDEAVKMIRLLKKLGDQLTMIVIEHNMSLVMSISSDITVLYQGSVIASGKPSDIADNPEVRKAYLGGHV
ncbi:MAG: ABC transporter ATP-binding protein [Desulfobacteraceae bacterium]|jgi:branched-chain amino acid transport system ATP-binding protein|nr:ABC transporter ATP-binding protein [Desulfobacteraceae bacterium]